MTGPVAGGASRGRARAVTTPGGLFVAAVLVLCALPVTSEIRDPDFWWHLRTGQLILDHRGLIATDPYTYTATTHHWTMHEWLTEVLFAAMHQVGGVALIVAVLSIVTWVGLVCIAGRAGLRHPHHLALGGGMVIAAVSGYPIWGPRAQMITFALTCVVLLIADIHLRDGGRLAWVLVPLFLVWSNLHSGFVIGAAFLVAIVVAEWLGGRLGMPGAAPPERVRSLLLVMAACAAAVVVNPNGPAIYLYPFETQGSAAQQALILEWHSPDFHDISVRAFEVMLLSLAVMVAVTRRVRPRDALLALGTTVMALQSVRHIALFVAAATPMWIEQADLCGRHVVAWRAARRSTPARPPRPAVEPPRAMRVLSYTTIGLLVAVWGAFKLLPAMAVREGSLTYAKDYPVCAARWLQAAPGGLRVFNQYGEGGYLALALTPHGDRVYIFGDAALMGDDLLTTYGDVETVRPSWESIVDASGTDVVLFDTGTSLADVMQQSPRWVEVYRDAHSVAFVRAGAAGARVRAMLPPQPVYAANDVCSRLDATATAATAAEAAR